MLYVPVHNDAADELNRQLYKLSRPEALQEPENASQFYCRVFIHPQIPFTVLEIPEEDTIPIHLAADASGLVAVLQPFVAQQQITQAELDGIIAAVQASAGQRFAPASMIPPSWQQYVLTREQAVAAGYIPQPPV